MTRINVVPVEELSDQHLIAEYRELPRVIKQKIDISDAPDKYCLGIGHMKFCKKYLWFTLDRYGDILVEMKKRGFRPKYVSFASLLECAEEKNPQRWLYYKPTRADIKLNRDRLIEKYKMKPNWYRWTKREKPKYMEA